MSGNKNYGQYESTRQEIETFMAESIVPFMMKWLKDLDRLRAERDEAANELAREVPRIITADELEVGQWIAWTKHWSPSCWGIQRYSGSGWMPGYNGTIVLLADAPTTSYAAEDEYEGDMIDMVGIEEWAKTRSPTQLSWKHAYGDQDHEDAEVTQWHEEPELPTAIGARIIVDSVYYPGDEGRGTPMRAVHLGNRTWALEGGLHWPFPKYSSASEGLLTIDARDITEWREVEES